MVTDKVTHAGQDPALEVCHVQGSCHVFPRHFHDEFYAVGLMHRGASYCLGPEKSDSILHQGQACLINPGQLHSGVPLAETPISYTMLYIRTGVLRALAEDISQRPQSLPEFTTLICTAPDRVNNLSRLAASGDGEKLARDTIMLNALADLLRNNAAVRPAEPGSDPQLVHRARELLREDLGHKLTLEDLATRLGASRYHIVRTFKRQTGVPPHVFRTQQRIELTRRLLRQGQSLSAVALAGGFTDQSHFSNTFKQFTGITPGQYVRSLR